MKPAKVWVACPQCGHTQLEPRAAYSTVCKKCGRHFRVQEVLHPAPRPPEPPRGGRRVHCFKCGGALDVPPTAQSARCRHCGSHVDLHDYRIASAVAKNFRTKGRLVIEADGFLFNTDSIGGDVILKGRLLGKIQAEGSLEIHPAAELEGTFTAGRLVIPSGTIFRWKETLALGGADIAGEVAANLRADGLVVLRSTARFFGQVRAGNLAVEEGAVFLGTATIGV